VVLALNDYREKYSTQRRRGQQMLHRLFIVGLFLVIAAIGPEVGSSPARAECADACAKIQDSLERLRCYDECAKQPGRPNCEPLCEAIRAYVNSLVRMAVLPPARDPIERQDRDNAIREVERSLNQSMTECTAKAPQCKSVAEYIGIWKPRFSLDVQRLKESFLPPTGGTRVNEQRSLEASGARLVEEVCRKASAASGGGK
jgi:hypothetical protein